MSKTSRALVAVMLAVCCGGLAGCTRTIGDPCVQNVDCSVAGNRFCDIASPAGYCTVEGCDYNTCPDGAACVRFFDLLRGAPRCEVNSDKTVRPDCPAGDRSCCRPGDGSCCRPGEQCLCDKQSCTIGYCASETSERRWCMHPCQDKGDCRDGYDCYVTGENGAATVPSVNNATPEPLRFCAPAPQF